MVQLISRIAVIGIGGWIGDLSITIILYALASGICRLGYLFWLAHISGTSAREIGQSTLTAFGFAVVAVLPILAGLIVIEFTPMAWAIALSMTAALVASRYWLLLRQVY